ncbi:hypothetical protein PHMEG_0008522 [Phytophthora megakarya]|uniref:Uncharacterized protein n=1 Tax=Phytophthora megakarya TaxID=4795 RepID=A0A225WII9_9STRA|nr:hypothetical protein PHMEG_0008522 [Phytophthora megakarya]
MYTTGAFMIEIPESNDAMLGMPSLEEVNPIIYWATRSACPRPSVRPANCIGGKRHSN